VAVADRALEIAEQLELTDVIADALVTKGMGLVNLGRGHEGLGLVAAALELARTNNLGDTEVRALGNLAVSVGARHIGDGGRLTHELIELERKMGIRSGLSYLNATEVARWTGEWDWADELQSELRASDLEGVDRVFARAADVAFKAVRGELRGGEQEELDRLAEELNDPSAVAIAMAIRPEKYLYGGWLREARIEAESQAQSDMLNAAIFLGIAAHAALWDGDLESLQRIHRGMEEMGGRGPLVAAQRRAMKAGIDALEGRRTDAVAGYRQAIRELDELGAVLDGLLTAIDMATALGPAEPEVRTQIDAARATAERLGARALLDRIDSIMQQPAPARAPVSESAAARVNAPS
jgi:hypothetical protein